MEAGKWDMVVGGGDRLDGLGLCGNERVFTPLVLPRLPLLVMVIDAELEYGWAV